MDPNDCDGEANARPISRSAALALIPAADLIGNGLVRDVDDTVSTCSGGDCGGPLEPGHRAVRLSGHIGIIVAADLRAERGEVGDVDDVRTIDEGAVGPDDTIDPVVALSTLSRRCTLCSVEIDPHTLRMVWSWPAGGTGSVVLHAHRGCDAIRREIDLDDWHEGDLLDYLTEWAREDRLNHDLGELDAGLTAEERADMGGEIIAAALRVLIEERCDIIKIGMDGDDDTAWTVTCCEEHDPLGRVWDTSQDARAELGVDLDWWEEEPGVWMAHLAATGPDPR